MMRWVVGIGAIGVVAVVSWLAYNSVAHAGKVALKVQVDPAAATIVVDGSDSNGGTLYLSPGQHTIEAEFTGFQAQSQVVNLTKPASVSFILNPNSQEGLNYLSQHLADQQKREAQGGAEAAADSNAINKYQSVISQLPFNGIDFNVSYGQADVATNSPGAIALYVEASTPSARQEAIDWIRQQGVDPSDIEIVYVGVLNPFVPNSVGE